MNATRCGRALRALLLASLLVPIAAAASPDAGSPWRPWATEAYNLEPGESFTFRVAFDQIPVRAWRLVVDADYMLSDLHVLRLGDGSLLYFKKGESHHEVDVPWGEGEEISIVLTADRNRGGGVYTVELRGPPQESAPAAYSFPVNRALEAYAAGRPQEAESLVDDALRADPDDGAACVLKAGFLRDRRYYDRAAAMVGHALALDLPDEMRGVALSLKDQLDTLQARLPAPVREGLEEIDGRLERGDGATALSRCADLESRLDRIGGASDASRVEIMLRRGRALQLLDRHFEAVDVYTGALTLAESRRIQAVIYFRMGQLFEAMDNGRQARDAYGIARNYGLPAALDDQAEAALARMPATPEEIR